MSSRSETSSWTSSTSCSVDADGLEQWVPVMKAGFPLSVADVGTVLQALARGTAARLGPTAYTLREFLDEVVDPTPTCSRSRCTRGGRATRSAAAWRS